MMNMWMRTKIEQAPSGQEVLLSDGKVIYLGTYDKETDCFIDWNKFCLPTPKYWHPLPVLPEK